MRPLCASTATAFAAVALLAGGCGDGENFDAGDLGDVKVVQGDLEQSIESTGACTATNVFGRACSRRPYPRSTLDPAYDPNASATVTFDGAARFELTVLQGRPGRKPDVIWRDEAQCIDSVCLDSAPLDKKVSGWLRDGAFVRVVVFAKEFRGFELSLSR